MPSVKETRQTKPLAAGMLTAGDGKQQDVSISTLESCKVVSDLRIAWQVWLTSTAIGTARKEQQRI
jgi:hypothetical protein